MIDFGTIIDKAGELVPMQPTALRLAAVLSSPDYGIDEVVKLASFDQAITAGVLRMANSVESSAGRRIETIKDALMRVGAGRVLRLIMGLSVKNSFHRSMPQYGYAENDLWYHGVAATAATECLASYSKVTIPPVSFTAALLHDIGKLLLSRCVSDDLFKEIRRLEAEERITWADAEFRVLGFTHADTGAALCESWKLPEAIVNAVANHHKPDIDFSPVTDAVRIANAVARITGAGLGNEGFAFAIDERTSDRLGLNRKNFEHLCVDTVMRCTSIRTEFGES